MHFYDKLSANTSGLSFTETGRMHIEASKQRNIRRINSDSVEITSGNLKYLRSSFKYVDNLAYRINEMNSFMKEKIEEKFKV